MISYMKCEDDTKKKLRQTILYGNGMRHNPLTRSGGAETRVGLECDAGHSAKLHSSLFRAHTLAVAT
jgi:hypothetical protein